MSVYFSVPLYQALWLISLINLSLIYFVEWSVFFVSGDVFFKYTCKNK